MLGLAAVPSILMFVGFLFMPESPRWLVFHKRPEKAQQVLSRIHQQDAVHAELTNITRDYEEHMKLKLSKRENHSGGDLGTFDPQSSPSHLGF